MFGRYDIFVYRIGDQTTGRANHHDDKDINNAEGDINIHTKSKKDRRIVDVIVVVVVVFVRRALEL